MAIRYTLSIVDLVEILFEHFEIEKGGWEIGFNHDIVALTSSRSADEKPMPTLAIRINGLNFVERDAPAENTYSPKRRSRGRRASAKSVSSA